MRISSPVARLTIILLLACAAIVSITAQSREEVATTRSGQPIPGRTLPSSGQSATNILVTKHAVVERLAAVASDHGAVRVIVGVAVPFAAEGRLAAADVASQRAAIRESSARVIAAMSGVAMRDIKRFESIPFFAATVDAAALRALDASAAVLSIQEDRLNKPTLMTSTGIVGANVAWAYGVGGAGWSVAVVDSGVDRFHPFLSGKVVSEACYSTTSYWYGTTSVCPGGLDATGPGTAQPCSFIGCEHGTHVAGIVAGKNASFSGVARDASIIAIKAASANWDGTITYYTSDEILGLERVLALRTTYNIAAVNMSLGGSAYTSQSFCDYENSAVKTAIDNLRSVGIATVVASGNDGYYNALSEPACISSAISVGATTKSDVLWWYSDTAPFLTLLAPGDSIYSSLPGGGYGYKSGTSMAAPHVAGAWALLKSVMPSASVTQIAAALRNTGTLIYNSYSGYWFPRIRIDSAAMYLLNGGAAAPGPPTGLTTSSSGSSILLSWHPPTSGGAPTAYIIEAGSAPGLANLANFSTGTTSTSYAASGVGAGVYYVRVRASNSAGTSAPSNEAVLTVSGAAPGAPTGLTASNAGPGTVVLNWNAASGNPTSYILEAGSAPGLANLASSDLGGPATTYTAFNVSAGTYYIRVRARNAYGISPASNEAALLVP